MTNRQHDELMFTSAKSIQDISSIAASMRRTNAIEILKELYSCGVMTTADYAKALLYVAEQENYLFKDKVDTKKIGL